jgi:hypothetical protein
MEATAGAAASPAGNMKIDPATTSLTVRLFVRAFVVVFIVSSSA